MCVIVGFTQKTRGREEVLACLDRAYTRGPDMARVAETASGWLGFRRLSIMGLDERVRIHEGFGQSETSVLLANFPWVEIRPGSMGKPAPIYDIDLLDEDGNSCEDGNRN